MEEPSRKKLKTAANPPKPSTGPRITDPRFANIQSDPRYRLPGKKNKVKLDKRFARVLEDEDFVKRAKVDRYGRPLESNAERKRLKRKYDFDEEEGEEEQSDVPDDDDEVQQELNRIERKTRDPLREGRDTDSESSSDETTSDEESEEEDGALEEEVGVGPTQQTDVPTGEVTSRIAVVNLDWDNIRAADLMAVFSSFLSSSDSLRKVSIYPSEFGKERLEREEMEGPPKEIFANPAKEDADGDLSDDEEQEDEDIKNSMLKPDDGTTDFDSTALRRYQLERLRYFYAILTFSSPSVAKQIYDAVDGTEYLRTANFFDLRFVPDDTDFSTDVPREECDRIPDDYRPNEFVTDALQHSKVKLTWDAEDGGRKEAVARAFKGGRKEIDENDLRAYLASDDEGDDEEERNEAAATGGPVSKKEAERQRMRTLLGLPPEPEKKKSAKKDKGPVGDMQITFTSGLSGGTNETGKKKSVFENSPEPEETTLEKYVRKERERKQKRKEKMKNAREGHVPETEGDAHDKDKGDDEQGVQAREEEGEDLGFEDPFFTEPSAASEKAASKKLRKEERLKKQKEREAEEEADRKQRAELELLMADDDADVDAHGPDGTKKKRIRHFDMREIQKAEKEERKKNKKKKVKAKKGDVQDENAQDEFKVDTADPRFSRLFESHEYAIDPTNPKFKGTKAMRALLEEGRRRKHRGDNERSGRGGDADHDARSKLSTGTDGEKKKAGDGDVKRLVEKIKRRQHG
ncbi:uncharacterized protein Z520_00911 [Fonsecaea multimorphosa CBS 102226]|uniref:Uncharacterized protein n=1 Tax=Fonsecaea multimorphosa CBS 102226 TaxID=1442371 RepID=A0A0D2KDN1_9EURO|nr:uncharacterized protein Z520_00911 [Fonsecaea multimorphosa CBS 102226]KIY04218.1 hypothetical protein Z520_00911 [Fonsecaea multimorphosa CBS 102226]OAL32044.1 hypothetical protein AYO22_00914 [Fonsecaea multimorphosa]